MRPSLEWVVASGQQDPEPVGRVTGCGVLFRVYRPVGGYGTVGELFGYNSIRRQQLFPEELPFAAERHVSIAFKRPVAQIEQTLLGGRGRRVGAHCGDGAR